MLGAFLAPPSSLCQELYSNRLQVINLDRLPQYVGESLRQRGGLINIEARVHVNDVC